MMNTRECPKCGKPLPTKAPGGICPGCLMLAGLADADSPAFAATTPQASPFVPASAADVAAHFPQLEVLDVLGHGGMGTVYKARQTKLDRLVALKIIRPESAEDPAFAERFNREARTLAKLSHANIVGVHDFGEVSTDTGMLYYFVMEYVDGPNLRQLVQTGEIQANQALAIIPQICEALQYAHDEGVVHRDIKPENILVDSKGRIRIADFGLAKLAERSAEEFTLTGTHQIMGTPRYMAPEQMEGSRTVDHRADIYSLGVVFYELLTGELPMGQFEPPSAKTGADARLDEVVMRALAREPERRFQSAGELKSQVDAISSIANVPPHGHEAQDPSYRIGATTIIEREAAAAWKWLAAEPKPNSPSELPAPPTMLMLLLSLAGCLSVLLPWMDVEITEALNEPTYSPTHQVTDRSQSGGYIPCLFQVGEAPPDPARGSSVEDFGYRPRTFSGLEMWPGIVVCGCFALMLLALISLPTVSRRKLRWLLPLMLLSVSALIHTLVFQQQIKSTWLQVPISLPTTQRLASVDKVPPEYPGKYHFCQDAAAADGEEGTREIGHRITYRSGFYLSLAMSVSMLVLTATGIRHSLVDKEQTRSRSVEKRAAMPVPIPERDQSAARPKQHAADVAKLSPVAAELPDETSEFGTTPELSPAKRNLLARAKSDLEPTAVGLILIGVAEIVGHLGFLIYEAASGYSESGQFLVALPTALLMIIGGTAMLKLKSRSWALVAGVCALLPLSPLWIISIFVGVIAIRALQRPDIQAAFDISNQQKMHKENLNRQAKFSTKAIIGAALIPLGLFFFAAVMMTTTSVRESSVGGFPTALLFLFVVLPCMVAPFVTTILGIMAISDIRQSAGRLTGLGLAFLDAVLFPSLIIDLLLIGLSAFCWPDDVPQNAWFQVALLICTIAILIANGIVLGRLWKSVSTQADVTI